MATLVGDSYAVDRLAGLYESAANQLADIGRSRAASIEGAVWQSPGANRYREAARGRRGSCEHNAEDMADIARALRRHANWIRETEADLRTLEQRIRNWAVSHPFDPLTPLPDASLIHYWPASYSMDWHDLAARLRANGAYF